MELNIRLEREDDIPAFAAFLRCEPPGKTNHVILLNVLACMSPECYGENGETVLVSREDRKREIITCLMHEFGHALESEFGLPVNEEAIEKACIDWEQALVVE